MIPQFYILHYRKHAAKRSLHRHTSSTFTGAKVRRRNEITKLFGENFTHSNKNSANDCKAIPPSHIGKSAKACNAVNEEKNMPFFTYIISYTF